MGILTNAGSDDRISPAAREAAEAQLKDDGILQDAEARARAAAARGERSADTPILPFEAQQGVEVEVAPGETRTFDGVALANDLAEVELDESVHTLMPFVLRWEECKWWPFGPRLGHNLRPVMPPFCWEGILEAGIYCMRCLRRHAQPHPEECEACGLTATHRQNAVDYMERVAVARETFGPNREQRRAMKRASGGFRRSRGGLLLPGG